MNSLVSFCDCYSSKDTLLPSKNSCTAQHCPQGGEQILAPEMEFLQRECSSSAQRQSKKKKNKSDYTFQIDPMSWPRLQGKFTLCSGPIVIISLNLKKQISLTRSNAGESMVTYPVLELLVILAITLQNSWEGLFQEWWRPDSHSRKTGACTVTS